MTNELSELTIRKLRKQYNDECIFLLSKFPTKKNVKSISTGSLLLDDALGVGGVPRGRVTEMFGPESSGKTTMCQHLVASAQREGIISCFIDVENAVDPLYAEACGVDLDSLYFSQPSFAEEALGIAEMLINSGEVGLIVIDSVASLSPEKEGEGEFRDQNVTAMRRAKLLNVFFRRNIKPMRENEVAVVFTNQLRDIVNSRWGGTKPTGGHGMRYYSSVRISLWRGKDIERGGDKIGQEIEASVRKNKVSAPFTTAKFYIIAGYGIDQPTDVLNTAITLGIIQKAGSYYKYRGDVIAQGFANSIEELRNNPEMVSILRKECRELLEG